MITPVTYVIGTYAAYTAYKTAAWFWMSAFDASFKAFAEGPLFRKWEDED